jgi:hypothetical protein
MSEYLNGNADCVELVLVPLNSIAAPSSISFIKSTPAPPETKYLGFDAGFDRDDPPVGSCGPGSCTKGWVFRLNSGWTDDESGFRQFISAARGLRVDVTNHNLTTPDAYLTSSALQLSSPSIPLYRFDIRYKAPIGAGIGQTGWDYLSGPTSVTRVSFSDPGGPGLPSKIYSRVDSGCLPQTCASIGSGACSEFIFDPVCPGVSSPIQNCVRCGTQTITCDGSTYVVCPCTCCQEYVTEVPYTVPPISAAATLILDGNFKLVVT